MSLRRQGLTGRDRWLTGRDPWLPDRDRRRHTGPGCWRRRIRLRLAAQAPDPHPRARVGRRQHRGRSGGGGASGARLETLRPHGRICAGTGISAVVAPRPQPVLDLGEHRRDDPRTGGVHLLVAKVVPAELEAVLVGDVEPVAPHPLAPAHGETAKVTAPDARGSGRRDGHEEWWQIPARRVRRIVQRSRSSTTLMSSGRRSNASGARSSGTRRLTSRPSQSLPARASASAAAA